MRSRLPASLSMMVIGLNHKSAPLAVRERMALQDLPGALGRFRQAFPQAEAVLLSTCNRVELYVARQGESPTIEELAAFLAGAGRLTAEELRGHVYQHVDRAAVQHLFDVTSSLDSMVVGETQILSQVKQAYAAAAEAGTVGFGDSETGPAVFHTLFQRALAAAKAVHEETALASGRLSIASVAVELARSVFDRFEDKTVLCIGAGKMSGLLLKHLAALGPRGIVVMNRSAERARAVAAEHGARVAELMETGPLVEADIIVTSTGATEPLLTAAHFKSLLKPRRYRPVVIVDIAVPRDVEAGVGKLNNVYLYNIDDLQQVAAGNKTKRDAEVERSRVVLQKHVGEFYAWFAGRDIGPIVKALYERAHAVARGEIDHYLAAHPGLPAADREDLERAVHRLVGKLLHGPVKQMTAQSKEVAGSEAEARPDLAGAIQELFQLRKSGEGQQ